MSYLSYLDDRPESRPCDVCGDAVNVDEHRCGDCHYVLEDAEFDPVVLARQLVAERRAHIDSRDRLLREAGAA